MNPFLLRTQGIKRHAMKTTNAHIYIQVGMSTHPNTFFAFILRSEVPIRELKWKRAFKAHTKI